MLLLALLAAFRADAQTTEADVFVSQAVVDLDDRRYKDAIRSLHRALQIEPDHLEALYYMGVAHLARRGAGFADDNMHAETVNGMDVLAVRGAAEVALEWTRSGKGPIILEFLTYRYRGHSMSDPAKYRTREEVQDYREHRDPIDHASRDLQALGVTEDELKAIDKEIKDIVVEAAKFAEEAPEPDAGQLHTDVLVESY